jgi:UDP-N-acetylmuramoyl-tripeptide--D-alanyl-D-alanine ligase
MMKIDDLYDIYLKSSGVSTDTRNINKGCLFFALKGANFNGNLFAEKALKEGAFKVVVDDLDVAKNDDYILVDDVLTVLQKLSSFHRAKLGIPIVAITGTNGKTTTKELVKTVLDKKYKVLATVGNLNNHIGVPLTLLSMDQDVELGVVEMGANHPGEIEILCNIADPDYGLITNVGKAHLEGFGSFEGVMKTKAELYRYIEQKNGVLFVNSDNAYLQSMLREGATLYTYGGHEEDKIMTGRVEDSLFLHFNCIVNQESLGFKTNLVGAYNRENVLAAIAIGAFFNVQHKDILAAVEGYFPTNNRSQMVVSSNNKILFDAYNANPTSMQIALDNFVHLKSERKVVVLGEMNELGDVSVSEHTKILEFLKSHSFYKVILVGKSYQGIQKGTEHYLFYDNVEELREDMEKEPLKDCLILVKGSRSNRLEMVKELL